MFRSISRRTAVFTAGLSHLAGRFLGDRGGSVFTIFAFALPATLLVAGGSLDYTRMRLHSNTLQQVADSAAVAGARELLIAQTKSSQVEAVVRSVVKAHFGADADKIVARTQTNLKTLSVTVDLAQAVDAIMLSSLMSGDVAAHAVAQIYAGKPLCVLGLDELAPGTVSLENSARLIGKDCAVISNSKSARGLVAKGAARLYAGLICSAGGASGGNASFRPGAQEDCPQIDDPLKSRLAPAIGRCIATDMMIGVSKLRKLDTLTSNVTIIQETASESELTKILDTSDYERKDNFKKVKATLRPGTYCGDLIIGGAAEVEFLPGEYVLRDGQLLVTDFAEVKGEHVGFYFHGLLSKFYFGPNTVVSLKAPKEGVMAGLLFHENRKAPLNRIFPILSDDARVLEGTIYLPRGSLLVDADKPVADKSAYTAIVARSLRLYAGPELVLNTNYDQTDVPVPAGIGPDSQVVLKE